MSSIINPPDGKYLCVHCNSGITYTNKIGNLPGYSNPFWYNLEGVSKIMSLGLVQKQHIVTYNSQYGNELVVHIPQRPTFKMTKAGLLYHNMRHLLKNNNAHTMVNDSRSPIPQVEEKMKQYTSCYVKRADCARQF